MPPQAVWLQVCVLLAFLRKCHKLPKLCQMRAQAVLLVCRYESRGVHPKPSSVSTKSTNVGKIHSRALLVGPALATEN